MYAQSSIASKAEHLSTLLRQSYSSLYLRKAHVHEERACQCANKKTDAEPEEAIRCTAGAGGKRILHTTHGRRLKCFNHPAAANACWTALTITVQPACTSTKPSDSLLHAL